MISPFDPAASAPTSASDDSPAVETRAAKTTSASSAAARTSSTVMSERKTGSGLPWGVASVTRSTLGQPRGPVAQAQAVRRRRTTATPRPAAASSGSRVASGASGTTGSTSVALHSVLASRPGPPDCRTNDTHSALLVVR